jgi:hypothetical protein
LTSGCRESWPAVGSLSAVSDQPFAGGFAVRNADGSLADKQTHWLVESHARDQEGVAQVTELSVNPVELLRVVESRVGRADARRVVDYLVAWTAASKVAGHPVTAVEYSEHWGLGEATGYRGTAFVQKGIPV